MPSPQTSTIPTPLKVLGWLFIIFGAINTIATIVLITLHQMGKVSEFPRIEISHLISIAAGIGILRRNKTCHKLLIATCWIGFIMAPLSVIVALFEPNRVHCDLNLLGIHARATGSIALISMAAVVFFFIFWIIHRILSSCASRRYFNHPAA